MFGPARQLELWGKNQLSRERTIVEKCCNVESTLFKLIAMNHLAVKCRYRNVVSRRLCSCTTYLIYIISLMLTMWLFKQLWEFCRNFYDPISPLRLNFTLAHAVFINCLNWFWLISLKTIYLYVQEKWPFFTKFKLFKRGCIPATSSLINQTENVVNFPALRNVIFSAVFPSWNIFNCKKLKKKTKNSPKISLRRPRRPELQNGRNFNVV